MCYISLILFNIMYLSDFIGFLLRWYASGDEAYDGIIAVLTTGY